MLAYSDSVCYYGQYTEAGSGSFLGATPRVTSNTPRCILPVFLNVNIRGGFCQKLDGLSVVLQQNNVDVACITETWLNPSIPSNLTTVDGYTTYRADRNDGRHGRRRCDAGSRTPPMSSSCTSKPGAIRDLVVIV